MGKFKTYLLIAMFSLMSFICGVMVNEAKAEINAQHNITNIQGVSYDYVYVNGTRYVVFMSQTGDIEVVKQ